jgi:hypothetical protein
LSGLAFENSFTVQTLRGYPARLLQNDNYDQSLQECCFTCPKKVDSPEKSLLAQKKFTRPQKSLLAPKKLIRPKIVFSQVYLPEKSLLPEQNLLTPKKVNLPQKK